MHYRKTFVYHFNFKSLSQAKTIGHHIVFSLQYSKRPKKSHFTANAIKNISVKLPLLS